MSWHRVVLGVAVAVVAAGATAVAQKPPAVRAIGRLERTTSDSLASAAAAIQLAGGRVLVNDITARRLLLFDSTLAHPKVIADTTSATANAYGTRPGTLIRYRGDTVMYIDIGSVSMLVIGPTGAIVRVMAAPPGNAQYLIGSIFGVPGFDGRGRLVYHGGGGIGTFTLVLCCVGYIRPDAFNSEALGVSDSAFVVRADLSARTIDTAAVIRIPKVKTAFTIDARGFIQSIQTTRYPLPLIDDWTVTSDGTIAVVRGRDYHVDWIMPDGKSSSSPKMPFDWQHVDDARKQALIDSAAKDQALGAQRDSARAAASSSSGGTGRGGANGGRGGGTVSGGGRRNALEIPNVALRPEVADLPDYVPAFARGAVTADADGNLWILTSTIVRGEPVYDIVNRRRELVDRVQLPSFRTIAGFGPGVVYMAVKDAAGIVRLERARVK
jgi:uncharacterized membrane protein YgcG